VVGEKFRSSRDSPGSPRVEQWDSASIAGVEPSAKITDLKTCMKWPAAKRRFPGEKKLAQHIGKRRSLVIERSDQMLIKKGSQNQITGNAGRSGKKRTRGKVDKE